jgi:hypothetical protein
MLWNSIIVGFAKIGYVYEALLLFPEDATVTTKA